MSKAEIFKNITNSHIFICTKFRADPYGGPGIPETTHCVSPSELLDLRVMGLQRVLLNKKKKAKRVKK